MIIGESVTTFGHTMSRAALPRGLTIRELKPDDYTALVTLWKGAGLPYRPKGRDSRERVFQELSSPTTIFLVAELEGELVGSLLGTSDGRKGWINRLAVRTDLRRRGVGRALLQEIERRFEVRGLLVFACLIEEENSASQEFFDELGYEVDRGVLYFSKRKGKWV
jgi:ribosomal protein S18 acetylase RimI-like enzyme